jgi:hypothetical protein
VVTFDRAKPIRNASAPADFDQTSLMLMGAAVRGIESAGALESILDLTLRYANERVAFERPIGKFQAVQHSLARLAGEVAAAMTAAGSAAETIAHARTFDVLRSRTRFTAPSASPGSTSCTALRSGCWPGGTTSAMRAIGQRRSAIGWPNAAPRNCGPSSPRDELAHRHCNASPNARRFLP